MLRALPRRLAIATAAICTVLCALPVSNAVTAAPVGYTNPPMAGWSVNGQVRAVLIVGTRIYVGGTFTQAISPLGTRVNRTNLAAFDSRTGEVISTFNASTDAMVRSLVTDGSRLYVGGNFTAVNSVARSRVAALDLATGVLDTGFVVSANADVYDLEVVGQQVFVAGAFTTLNTVNRARLGAVDSRTGVLDPNFTIASDAMTRSLKLSADGTRLYVGGRFNVIGGVTAPRLASIDLATRTINRLAYASLTDEIIDIDVSPDGSQVYGAVGGAANLVAAWDSTSGVRQWYRRTDGDVQAVRYAGGNVYYGFHEGENGDVTVRLLAADATSGTAVDFRPTVDSFYGVWDIDASSTNLVVGGEFRIVSGVAARGFANFTTPNAPRANTLVSARSEWKYLDTGVAPAADWASPTYDDTTWRSGLGQLGYGDGDEATVLGWGTASTKAITTWFRKTIVVQDPTLLSELAIDMIRDDGAVVYVNGAEVARSNMPTGTITATTRASSSASPENAYYRHLISSSAFVTGANTIAVEVHQDSPNTSDMSFDLALGGIVTAVPVPVPTAVTILPARSAWKYLDDASNQGTAWRESAFDDSTWQSGAGQLGYGDGDEATVIGWGPGPSKAITSYYRRTVDVPDPSILTSLAIDLVRDDGAVVYVNGVEVARSNMPTGTIISSTRASSSANPENAYYRIDLSPSVLVAGTNVIAVEIHQETSSSSDASFDMAITGVAMLLPA